MNRLLSSGTWELRHSDEPDWLPAAVPGEVHTALFEAGKIADPFYGRNEYDLQWIDKADWHYRTTFTVTSEMLEQGRIELAFNGLDTYADVFLNDQRILEADNYHRQWSVEVKEHLSAGENTLLVHLHSPIKRGLELMKEAPFIGKVGNDDNETGQVDGKVSVFSRKPHYHYGWDWGPRFVTSGIHDTVILRAWSAAKIEHVHCIQQQVAKDEATVDVDVAITSEKEQTCTLTFCGLGPESDLEVQLHEGLNTIRQQITINNPRLWWPNGLGEQNLYDLTVTLAEGKTELDSRAARIGLRTIQLCQTPDETGEGSSFHFEVNGVPVFMKGANYIPQDNFVTRPTAETYRTLLDNTVAANMNMLRIWGGGIYEKDLFYELCDEKGILIWQDFMFANRDYVAYEGFYDSITAEARDAVRRLRNHACLALWCGNNEMAWQHQANYKDTPKDTYFEEVYQRIFHEILPSVVAEHDPITPYRPSSPTASEDGGLPSNLTGDQHSWQVWHGEEPFEYYQTHVPRFMSEYGFQSFPAMETIRTFSTKDDWDIDSPVMKAHQKNGLGNRKIKNYMEAYYREPKDFESFVYLSQVQQAQAIKVGMEAHRLNMPWCMGSLYWQLNDCWPVASWASLDSAGDWKALHYQARTSFAPQLIAFEAADNTLKVYLVSDALEALQGNLQVQILDFHGKKIWQKSLVLSVPPNASSCVLEIDLGTALSADPKKAFLHATLEVEQEIVAENCHYFDRVRNLELISPSVQTECSRATDGYVVTLTSPVLAKSVYLSVPGHDVFFGNNYFDLLPNAPMHVHCRTKYEIPEFDAALKVITITDACNIWSGTYRETVAIKTSGTADKPIRFVANGKGRW